MQPVVQHQVRTGQTAYVARMTRSVMLNVLSDDYIRTARAKGLPALQVIFKHALRNAVVPVVALSAVQLGYLLGGSVVIETIFALDGLGYLAYQSITFKDVEREYERLNEAVRQSKEQLLEARAKVQREIGELEAMIFDAHLCRGGTFSRTV